MAGPTSITLHGRVTKDDGIFVVVVDGPNWTTYAPAFDEALNDVPRMVTEYLNAYESQGRLAEYLERLGFQGDRPDELTIIIKLDVTDVIPMSVDPTVGRVTYPSHDAA